jgi:hypothetical protein
MMKLLLALAIFCTAMYPVSAGANHEGLIYGPCGVETGYIHMTYLEVDVQVQERINSGDLDSNAVSRNSVGIIVYGTPHDILIAAGVIQEYAVNKFDQVLRYDDPFWGNISMVGWTEWEVGCYGLTPVPTTTTTTTVPTYSLTSAESDGYPTEVTRNLLGERYPLSATNKYHFDLDTAVLFLQQGGALSGLDNVWNIYE